MMELSSRSRADIRIVTLILEKMRMPWLATIQSFKQLVGKILPHQLGVFLASAQRALEIYMIGFVRPLRLKTADADGLVVGGGAGFNVFLNAVFVREFGLPVHVPPDPGDSSVPSGAAYLTEPPRERAVTESLLFLSPRLLEVAKVRHIAKAWNASRATAAMVCLLYTSPSPRD